MQDIRLPRNAKEGILYGSIICLISVTIMLSVNVLPNFKTIDLNVILIILKSIPIVFIFVFLLENILVGKIANKLVNIFSEETDSFNAKILFNILFCVTMISIIMTLVGPILGNGISMELLTDFPIHWPRNFCIALFTELLIAQPLARLAMKKIHNKK